MTVRLIPVLLLAFTAQAADAPTAEQLRAMAQRAAEKQQEQAGHVTGANPSKALPKTTDVTTTLEPVNPKAPDTPQPNSDRTGAPSPAPHRATRPSPTSDAPDTTVSNGTVPSGRDVAFDVVGKPKARYGIRLGTRLYGEIRRNVSSAEPGLAEIFLTQDTLGTRRTLPAGTQLFAQMRVNGATKRLELTTTHGITPDGDEFEIVARAYDVAAHSGLAGIVQDNSEVIASKGVNRGLIAAGKAATRAVGQAGGIAGAAAAEGANSVLGDTEQVMQQELNPVIVVYVSPQPLVLRVEKSF